MDRRDVVVATFTLARTLCVDQWGVAADYFYGPFLLARDLAAIVDLADERLGWGWRPFVFGAARRMDYAIVPIEGDYECPPDQRDEDAGERLHRLRQLSQTVDGLVRSATVVLPSR